MRLQPVLLVCLSLAACGLRTSMDTPNGGGSGPTPGPDARPDVGPGPDRAPDTGPARPDTGPDRGPDARPDAGPDSRPDAGPDRPDAGPDNRPDAPPDTPRFPEVGPDLPLDRPPEVLVRDLAVDTRDVPTREARPDLNADIVKLDLPAEPPLRPDGPCILGSTQPCVCDNGLTGNQICLPTLVYSECGCGTADLMRVKNGMIGEWLGTASNPWVSDYKVSFTFDSYSHYSAKSLDSRSTALYYGVDDDSPLKRYSVDDMQANGDAVGTIDIYFGIGDTVRDKLESIQLSGDQNRLKFYFVHSGEYGPLQYDLVRVVP